MTAPRRKPRTIPDPHPAEPFGRLDDDGVMRIVVPVYRYRVMFRTGAVIDVESAETGGGSRVGRVLADFGGEIAGYSHAEPIGWSGPTVPTSTAQPPGWAELELDLRTGSPETGETDPGGVVGAADPAPTTT